MKLLDRLHMPPTQSKQSHPMSRNSSLMKNSDDDDDYDYCVDHDDYIYIKFIENDSYLLQ